MSRRYDFAMQRHGKGQRKKRKSKLQDFQGFQGVSLFKEQVETDTDTNRKWDITGTQSPEEPLIDDSLDYSGDPRDIPLTVHAVGIGQQPNATQIGQEFSGITDRISKLLQDYESMYDDADHQGYAAMQEHLSGQMAMENLLSDYTSLCRDREELLNSLQDSLDVDEDEVLEELEKIDLKKHQIDMDAAQRAVHDTFQNVRDTSERLKAMNKKMVEMSKQGEAIENLEVEKRQLERELQMYKKMAVQQRKDIFARRASTVRKEETQQWKMVASEMVDILKMVRHEGNLDKESLEKELNRILMTLNTQNEYIENLKRDLSKSEKSVKNLEKEKNTLNDEKLVVQSQLSNKQNELKQCKQYLRKVMAEKKEPTEKIKFEGGEIDLKEDEGRLVTLDDKKPNVDILQAQIRDSKRLLFMAEEENRDLKRKLASITEKKEQDKEPPPAEAEHEKHDVQAAQAAPAAAPKQCLQCASYKAQLVNKTEELKEANAYIARLKDQLNNLRAQLKTTQKETTFAVKSQLALVEAGAKEEELDRPGSFASSPAQSEASASSEPHSESREDEVKEEPKQSLAVPSQKPKQQPGKLKASPRQAKTTRKKKEEVKEVKEEHSFEGRDDKAELSAINKKNKQQQDPRGVSFKPRDLVVGECREEKAPYVTVREARMVTLSEKGTQTTHYDRKASEGITQRDSVGPRHSIQHRRRSIADAIMACVPPNVVEHETSTALMFIKEEADRLCDEISSFVEFGFDFVQQGAKSNRIQCDVHLGEDKTRELLELTGADSSDQARSLKSIPSNEYRRQSLSSHKKRRGTIQLERRGTIHRKESTKLPLIETNETRRTRQDSILEQPEADCGDETAPSMEQPPPVLVNTLFPQQQETGDKSEAPPPLPQMADAVNNIMDKTFVKSKWGTLKHLFRSLQPHKGGGCSHVLGEIKTIAEESETLSAEDQVKEQVTVMAQHVIDTLQSTAQVMSYQMEEELNFYEKFYERWGGIRQAKRAVTRELDKKEEVPVVGKQVLLTERGPDHIHAEDSMMTVPHINSQISNYKSKQGQAIATAGLASSGMMMIQGSGSSSGDGIPHSTSQSKVKKRATAQSWSRKQLLMKQKAYMEKVLHVDAKLEDLNRLFTGMGETQSLLPTRYGQRIPPTLSLDYSLPLMAQSLALPPLSKRLHVTKGKSAHNLREVAPREMNADLNVEPTGDNTSKDIMHLPGMNTNTTWNRKQSIAQFPSQSTMKKTKEKSTKLPFLTINHLLNIAF